MTHPVRAALAALTLAVSLSAQHLPGQIVRDPEHPSWLLRSGGEHVFLVGPGDPEDFLYRGELLPDGTRDGDQLQIVQRLADLGGNTLYVQAVRSHGGDGQPDHNPFVDHDPALGLDAGVLAQWSEWFQAADAAGIVICFFVYDDSAKIWDAPGDVVGAAESAFVTALTNALEEHPNLILLVSEESEEARTPAVAQQLAALMRAADDHDHLIGDHHHTGDDFKSWSSDSVLEVFGMQNNVEGDAIHHAAVGAYVKGTQAGPDDFGWLAIYAEAYVTSVSGTDVRRHFIWDAALGGLQSMVFGMDVVSTPDEQLAQCRVLQEFMQSCAFWTLAPADERAAAGTRWALADAHDDTLMLYTREPEVALGVTDLPASTWDLHWVDCVTGATREQLSVASSGGTTGFTRPAGIGAECAVVLRRAWKDLGAGKPGALGTPELEGSGPVSAGGLVTLQLSGALPLAPALLVIGLEPAGLPFKGGTMLPEPTWLVPLLTDLGGGLSVQGAWPEEVPAGIPVFVQVWVQELLAYAATNALGEVTH